MKTFKNIIEQHSWQKELDSIVGKTETDVINALNKSKIDLEDFKALISNAAKPFLEQMAQKSKAITQKRFGKTIQMYLPMYLSNECQNICTYCGFSMHVDIARVTLTDEQILKEKDAIKAKGFDHILLLTGEANQKVGIDYLVNAVTLLRPFFSNISIEVQPLKEEEYKRLVDAGVFAVLIYQETYHKASYKNHHTKGRKSNYNWRLETPERAGKAGIYKIGLGALLGLEDWRTDSFFTALHLDWLQRNFWQSKFSLSFPRLRPCEGNENNDQLMTDKDLVQLICAFRIFNEDVELSLSTRESPKFRDNIIALGITSTSAESKTNPGGYATEKDSLEQFEIDDTRSVTEIEAMIKKQGYTAVFKDWDLVLG